MLMDYSDIARRIEDTYQYIMVDEYQDTNALQDSIIKKSVKKYKSYGRWR